MAIERVSVLGLDALTYDYLERMVRSGSAPNLRIIMDKSYKYVLDAFPPITPPSWSSILTGVNPGKHGVFGFIYMNREKWEQKIFTAEHLEHPRIHEMLAMLKIPSVMVNPIPDYPIPRIKGVRVVSHSFFTPKTLCYPDSLKKYAEFLGPPEEAHGAPLEVYVKLAERYLTFVEDVADRFDWRLFWLNLPLPDHYLHHHPELLMSETIPRPERDIFGLIDGIASRLAKRSDAFLIVSDHGFKAYDKVLSVNKMLYDLGYVRLASREPEGLREHTELLPLGRLAADSERKMKKYRLLRVSPELALKIRGLKGPLAGLKRLVKRTYKAFTGRELSVAMPSVDLRESAAFLEPSVSGIYVKEPGHVPKIIAELSGRECIEWIKRREEVYWGPFIHRAPDLLIRPRYNEGCFLSFSRILGSGVVRLKNLVAHHSPDAVLLIHAPVEEKRKPRHRLPPYSVTPIVMGLLRAPLPIDADFSADDIPFDLEFDVKRFNYVSRWRMYRKAMRLRTR